MSFRPNSIFLLLLALTGVLAACSSSSSVRFGGTQSGKPSVTLSMTSVGDTPPAGVSVLALQVTITDARLNPSNVELLTGPVTVDISRLKTETSLLSTMSVTPATYTSIELTMSSALLTFQNNSGSSLTAGGVPCVNGAICKASIALTGSPQSVGLPGAGITVTSGTPAALLVDASLTNLLANTAGTLSMDLGANGALSAEQITSAGAPFATIEDVVGTVSGPANNEFTLQTAMGSYSLTANSSTQFLNFPTTACTSVGFVCLAPGQIVSVNMSLQTDNTLIATDVFFEDATSALPEIEGVVVSTGGLPSQFSIVVLQETPAGSGPALGNQVSVAPNATPFGIDNLVGTINTQHFSFASTADLIVGQEVQVQQGTGSTASVIKASRVLLRSSRITGIVSSTAFPNFELNDLPPFLQNASPANTQILVETATTFTPNGTSVGGSVSNLTQIQVGRSLSARGQLFANNGSPTMLATRVVEH